MFTGIVQSRGILIASAATAAGRRLTVSLAELAHAPIQPGDSVCVSGVCLTAVRLANNNVIFDAITETLNRSTLGKKSVGDRVNLELSLQPSSFLGGHFVQGHVDALGQVVSVQSTPEDFRLTTRIPKDCLPMVVPKGSITIEGVSMTIASVDTAAGTFTLAIIPTTLERTTLGSLTPGDLVNLETDILARTVVHYLKFLSAKPAGPPITLAALVENGFV